MKAATVTKASHEMVGKKVSAGLLSRDAIREAGLAWEVKKVPYYLGDGRMSEHKWGVVRTDNNAEINGVGKGWSPVQNVEAFEFMDALFGKQPGLSWEQAGAFKKGAIVFLQLKVGQVEVAKDDFIDKYITMLNFHGSGALMGCFTALRLACMNQLSAIIKTGKNTDDAKYGGRFFSFAHTSGVLNRMAAAEQALAASNKWYQLFLERAKFLAKTDVPSAAWVDEFLTRLAITPSDKEEGESVRNRRVEKVRELFENGRGNTLASTKNTVWALYNGVTEYVDHYAEIKKGASNDSKDEARQFAAMVGHTRRLKEKAFTVALEMAGKI